MLWKFIPLWSTVRGGQIGAFKFWGVIHWSIVFKAFYTEQNSCMCPEREIMKRKIWKAKSKWDLGTAVISGVVPVLQVHVQLNPWTGLIERVGGLKQGSQKSTNWVVNCLKPYPTRHAAKGWDLHPNQLLTYSPTSGCGKHLLSLSIYKPDSDLELGDQIIFSINWMGFEQFFPFFQKELDPIFPSSFHPKNIQ